MALNRNNFIRWTGAFNTKPFTLSASATEFNFYSNQDSAIIQPLSGCLASNGINTYSFKVTSIKDGLGNYVILSAPCEWDGISNLTIYRPVDLTVTLLVIRYSFEDVMGNSYYSSTFDDSLVNISSISTTWIPFPASSVCVLNTQGFNTGYQMWGQLKLVNQSTMSDIIPLQLKPNSPSDGDYVAPVQNFGLCPTPSAGLFAPLVISNFSKSGADTPPNANFIIIDSIYLYSPTLGVGSTPIALNYTCNIWPGGSVRFLVPAGVWANLTIGYHLYGNIDTSPIDRFWKSNNNGVVTTLANIINIPPFTTTDINIPPTSQGVIVFAQ